MRISVVLTSPHFYLVRSCDGASASMGVITILCPNTGRQVSTGIKLSRAHFDRMRSTSFTLTCWACGGEHVWSKRWASYSDDESGGEVLADRAGAREWARPGR